MSLSKTACIFFFNYTPTTEIYTLSLHAALPIFRHRPRGHRLGAAMPSHPLIVRRLGLGLLLLTACAAGCQYGPRPRSEEHKSELQSRQHTVCRLLLEKKKSSFPQRIQ